MLKIIYTDGTYDELYKNTTLEQSFIADLKKILNNDSHYIFLNDYGIHINKDCIKKIEINNEEVIQNDEE